MSDLRLFFNQFFLPPVQRRLNVIKQMSRKNFLHKLFGSNRLTLPFCKLFLCFLNISNFYCSTFLSKTIFNISIRSSWSSGGSLFAAYKISAKVVIVISFFPFLAFCYVYYDNPILNYYQPYDLLTNPTRAFKII